MARRTTQTGLLLGGVVLANVLVALVGRGLIGPSQLPEPPPEDLDLASTAGDPLLPDPLPDTPPPAPVAGPPPATPEHASGAPLEDSGTPPGPSAPVLPGPPSPPPAGSGARAVAATVREIAGRLLVPEDTPEPTSPRALVVRRVGGGDAPAAPLRAPLASDGSFRLAVPAAWRAARVELDARALFLPAPVTLELGGDGPLGDAGDAGDAGDPGDPGGVWLELEPVLGLSIEGTVRPAWDVAGTRLDPAGVRIELVPVPGRADPLWERARAARGGLARRATLGEGGAFELRGLPPLGAAELVVTAPGFLEERVRLADLVPGERRRVEVELHEGLALRGVVLGEEEEPLAGVRVTARWAGRPAEPPLARATSADDGSFRLSGLPADLPGPLGSRGPRGPRGNGVELTCEAPRHFLPEPVEVELAPTAALDPLRLALRRGGTLALALRWYDGTPAANAEVWIAPDAELSAQAADAAAGAPAAAARLARADEHGRLRLEGQPPARHTVWVAAARSRAPGDLDRGSGRFPGLVPSPAEHVLRLEPRLLVEGTARDAAGQPLAGVRIEARRLRPRSPSGGETLALEVTTAAGAFRLRAFEAGEWELAADAPGCSRSAPQRVVLTPEAAPPQVAFVLEPAPSLSGHVRSPGGAPLAGALVRALRLDDAAGGTEALATADAAGAFRFPELDQGRYRLVALDRGHARSEELELELGPEPLTEPVLVLRSGAAVAGLVLDTHGAPRPGTPVAVVSLDLLESRTLRADAEGRFVVERLPPGRWEVWSYPPELVAGAPTVSASLSVELAEGERRDLELRAR